MLGFAPLSAIPLSSAPIVHASAPGRPLVFTAIPERFEFRAEPEPFTFTSLTDSFIFRGIPE